MISLSKVGMGQISITQNSNLTYNGFSRNPVYTISGCCNTSLQYTDLSTGNSLGINAPKVVGNYRLRITFIDGPDLGFFKKRILILFQQI